MASTDRVKDLSERREKGINGNNVVPRFDLLLLLSCPPAERLMVQI